MDVGVALSEKPALTPVTVRVTVVVSIVLPDVPVTVIVYFPVATEEATEMFIVEEPAPVIDDGLKLTVTPAGWPDAESAMLELNPPVTVLLTVVLPALP